MPEIAKNLWNIGGDRWLCMLDIKQARWNQNRTTFKQAVPPVHLFIKTILLWPLKKSTIREAILYLCQLCNVVPAAKTGDSNVLSLKFEQTTLGNSWTLFEKKNLQFHFDDLANIAIQDWCSSVSYTHLDVYKRQTLHRPIITM